ncbi:MAG: PepSY-like domain-containing protein [Verrucomicrobiales bacterium]|jgi:hypothetical protein|nr:PepSY-like domain-containing protein [Verrucomicrobiales bacterium]
MKKLFLLVAGLMIGGLAQAGDMMVNVGQLPQPVKAFVSEHFPKQKISYALLDKDLFSTKYELTLDNATEIEITPKGEWLEIDGRKNPVPDTIVPAGIIQYVKVNAGGVYIREIKRKGYGYEVELSGGLELKFNKKAEFLRLDD